MTDDLATLILPRKPTPDRPLLGLTVLIVEDSRFASEAMRLLCLRSGARIRRADCLTSARRHLSSYRPAVVIVDLGLPDGSGAELIRDLAGAETRVPVLLGISGDPDGAAVAREAGADGFLEKPVTSLCAFQQEVLAHLPDADQPAGLRALPADEILPDRIALHEDLNHIATILSEPVDEGTLDYVTQFAASLAQCAGDSGIADAAGLLRKISTGAVPLAEALTRINALVAARPGSAI